MDFQVNGPAVLYVNTGAGDTPEPLAVTETGVRVSYHRFRDLIRTDVSFRAPAEIQYAGEIAMVAGKMVAFDPDVLDKLRGLTDAAQVGQLGTTGLLLGTGGYTVELWVDGTGDRPHHFFTAILWEDEDEQLATRRTEDNVTFYCWPFLSGAATKSLATPLFEYARPPGVT
jgi:hypothetical protein